MSHASIGISRNKDNLTTLSILAFTPIYSMIVNLIHNSINILFQQCLEKS
jgi:hypothetical protein